MSWGEIIQKFEQKKQAVAVECARKQAQLPLHYYRQQAQFTTPASDYAMLEKAVNNGFSATPKILEKFLISHEDLAQTFGVNAAEITSLLKADPRSPFVMVDGEDAQALRDDVVERGRKNALRIFHEGQWGHALKFYRPSGLNLNYCVRDFVEVLGKVGEGCAPEDYPIHGIVFPKLDHPNQMEFVCALLSEIEKKRGLAPNQIKLQFLVESGWGLIHLEKLIEVSLPRLTGIIFGIADYSASINLPHIVNNHPACDLARIQIVNAAGAVGVPAIDNMTVNYPVADAKLSSEQNRARILSRLKECFEDARHGEALGMDGKWVGHPLQLFTVLLAYRTARPAEEMETEIRKLEAYHQAVQNQLGATIIEGVMSDRATDRHARQKLRKAVATGRVESARALSLGIITEQEARSLQP